MLTLDTTTIKLPNGYQIRIKKEEISHVGRSAFRGFDKEQVVLEISDTKGKITNRFGIPSSISQEVARFIGQ